ncbi:MAG: hypothetical protein RIT37_1099 [Bacteroidota bacterium]|jgi:hypothetical protein
MSAFYEVTMEVDSSIAEEWVEYMRSEHIPEVMTTGVFTSCQFLRIIEPAKEGFDSFRITYEAENLSAIQAYRADLSPELRRKHDERYGDVASGSRREMIGEFGITFSEQV